MLWAVLALLAVAAAAVTRLELTDELFDKVRLDVEGERAPSAALPERVPLEWQVLSQAAALAQEPYCPMEQLSLQIGDAELLWKSEDALFQSRVSVFRSRTLGVVLSYEGTDVFTLNGYMKDADFLLVEPAPIFDGVFPEGTRLDRGFQRNFVQTAGEALPAVKRALAEHNERRVTVTGHSLGAATGQLAAVRLEHELGRGTTQYLGFAPPRVGNQKYADYVDEKLGGRFFYAINGDDVVPRLPPRALGYQHASGQIWIHPANSARWQYCPGQENRHCSLAVVPDPAIPLNHLGTYFHTMLGWGPLLCPPGVGNANNMP